MKTEEGPTRRRPLADAAWREKFITYNFGARFIAVKSLILSTLRSFSLRGKKMVALRNFIFVLITLCPCITSQSHAKDTRLRDITDALQCAAGKIAKTVGAKNIPSRYNTLKFTISVSLESTNERDVKAGLKDNVIVLFPAASAEWKNTHVRKQTLAENFSFRRNLHADNVAACNRRSNFDTGVVDDVSTQIELVSDKNSPMPETNIRASSLISTTNNKKLAASLSIPFLGISSSFGQTTLQTINVTVISP